MKDLKSILSGYQLETDKQKRISREFQDYAYRLAIDLDDLPHKSLYMRMAKQYPRNILEDARSFVKDSNARNRGGLFMWKVKQLSDREKDKKSSDKIKK